MDNSNNSSVFCGDSAALGILNSFLGYFNFDSGQTAFTIHAGDSLDEWELHDRCAAVKAAADKYDGTGMLAACLARSIFDEYISSAKVSLRDALSGKFRAEQNLSDLFSGPEFRRISGAVLQTAGSAFRGSDRIGSLDESSFSCLYDVFSSLENCRTDWYECSGNPCGKISRFVPEVILFPTLGECMLSVNSWEDGIYLCYIENGGTCDGFFAFMIRSSGNLFSVSDRIQESYIGEHLNRRNGRYLDEKGYELFPYSIFDGHDFDSKGYARRYSLNTKRLDFSRLEGDGGTRLVFAMLFISCLYSGKNTQGKEITFTNSLFPGGKSGDCRELALAGNRGISERYSSLRIVLDESEILHGHLIEDTNTALTGVPASDFFISLWSGGFRPQKDYLREIAGVSPEASEYICTLDQMRLSAWCAARKDLKNYICGRMAAAFKADGFGARTVGWFRQKVLAEKTRVMEKLRVGAPYFYTQEKFNHEVASWENFRGHLRGMSSSKDFAPFNCGDKDESGLRCSVFFKFYPKSDSDIADLLGMSRESLPVLIKGYTRDAYRTCNNSILNASDPCQEISSAFTEFCREACQLGKTAGFYASAEQRHAVFYNYDSPFDFYIGFTKRGYRAVAQDDACICRK
jgi:hypothetical protein